MARGEAKQVSRIAQIRATEAHPLAIPEKSDDFLNWLGLDADNEFAENSMGEEM
ncbi:MAG TPA: hypothetical protein VG713_05135 [Pirellulales bacterium]|nr:hypothetical protein [Pirellulales bacterium]